MGGTPRGARSRRLRSGSRTRPWVLVALVLVLVQAGLGMVVNLYAAIPDDHPGTHPANYFSRSLRSVGWALGQTTGGLAFHAGLGLALIVVAIGVAWYTAVAAYRWVAILAALAVVFIIGAAFNGASFLDFGSNDNLNSLVMGLLALGAVACYGLALFLLPGRAKG